MRKPKKLSAKSPLRLPLSLEEPRLKEVKLTRDLKQNLLLFKEIFHHASDVIYREFVIKVLYPHTQAVLIYVEGLADKERLEKEVLYNLMEERLAMDFPVHTGSKKLERVVEAFLTAPEVKKAAELGTLVDALLVGDGVLLLEGIAEGVIIGAKGWKSRPVEEGSTEMVIKGPRDCFTEDLNVNIALIRRRIKSPRLKVEKFTLGSLTKTDVMVVYIQGLANDKVVEEVRRRLGRINIDSVLGSNYLEELIEDEPYTIFGQINDTERPDKVAGGLLEGQVAIIVDTTPFVLLVPFTFPQFLQSPEDYYQRYTYASFIRLIRMITLNLTLLFPAIHVAITTFHQEMLPSPLFYSIVAARQGVPFPTFVETLIMEVIFEVLREGGIRLPRPMGNAVSIVGAIVLGQASVAAGIVSPAVVIIVSTTAIASFAIPTVAASNPIRMLRFLFIVSAAVLGLVGIIMVLVAVLLHLCSLRSFGVPFLAPLAPMTYKDLKDIFIRSPWWVMVTRPRFMGSQRLYRQNDEQKPAPFKGKEEG